MSFKLMKKAQIMKLIENVFTARKKLDELINEAFTQAAAYAQAHNDLDPMERLISVLPKGYLDKNGFRNHMQQFTPLRIDPKSGKVVAKKPGEPGYKPYALEEARVTPMANQERNANQAERFFSLQTLDNLLAGMRKRADRAREDGTMIEADKSKIYKRINQIDDVLINNPMKSATVVSVADEAAEDNRKQARERKPRLIAERRPRTARTPRTAKEPLGTPANKVAA